MYLQSEEHSQERHLYENEKYEEKIALWKENL